MNELTTEMDVAIEDERRGYRDQMRWLQGKSIPAAGHALAARLATLTGDSYNCGGNAATADYITHMRTWAGA